MAEIAAMRKPCFSDGTRAIDCIRNFAWGWAKAKPPTRATMIQLLYEEILEIRPFQCYRVTIGTADGSKLSAYFRPSSRAKAAAILLEGRPPGQPSGARSRSCLADRTLTSQGLGGRQDYDGTTGVAGESRPSAAGLPRTSMLLSRAGLR